MKKTPMRTDIATRKRCQKADLLRLVRVDGAYVYDPTGIAPGRGIYISKTKEALAFLSKKDALLRKAKAPLKEGELAKLEAAL